MSKSIDLVVARYKEDLSWISQVPHHFNIIVYNKDDSRPIQKKYSVYSKVFTSAPPIPTVNHPNVIIITLPNVGRESDTYLHHIITNYNKLADTTIFTQGDPFTHSPDFLKLLEKTDQFGDIQPLTDRYMGCTPPQKVLDERHQDYVDGLRACAYPMCFTNYQTVWFHDPGSVDVFTDFNNHFKTPNGTNVVEYVMEKNGFECCDVPLVGHFCYAAVFSVDRENILKHPLHAYKNLCEMNNNSNKMFPSVLERIWLYLFGFEATLKRRLN